MPMPVDKSRFIEKRRRGRVAHMTISSCAARKRPFWMQYSAVAEVAASVKNQ